VDTLGYRLETIHSHISDRCEIGVAIPQFLLSDGIALVAANDLIEKTIGDVVEAFLWVKSESSETEIHERLLSNDGLWIHPIILSATRSLISVELNITTYGCGAHRNHYTRAVNIDVEHSSELALADILKDHDSAALFFSKYCESALKVHWDLAHVARWELDLRGASTSQSLGFRNSHLVLIFAPHHVGPHNVGRTTVEIPFNAAYHFLTDRMIDLLSSEDRNGNVVEPSLANLTLVPIEGPRTNPQHPH